MRFSSLGVILLLGFLSVGCQEQRSADRDDPGAREAGREAYQASKDLKQGAKEAAEKLRNAGKEFREGWSEAKHQDPNADRRK